MFLSTYRSQATAPYTEYRDGARVIRVPIPVPPSECYLQPDLDWEGIALSRWSDARIPEPCSNCFAQSWFTVLSTAAFYAGEDTGDGAATRELAWKNAAFAAYSYEIKQRHDEAVRMEIDDLRKEWFG